MMFKTKLLLRNILIQSHIHKSSEWWDTLICQFKEVQKDKLDNSGEFLMLVCNCEIFYIFGYNEQVGFFLKNDKMLCFPRKI